MRYLAVASVAAAVLALSIVAVPAAQAGPPTSGSGTFTLLSSVVTNVSTVGPNTILKTTDTYALTGSFSGTQVCDSVTGINSTGGSVFKSTCAFTGSVDGHAGGTTSLDVGTGAADGSFQGHVAVLSGTGDLANLRSQGTFEGVSTPTTANGTYSVKNHFAP